ncbi:MAG: PASTA domain-containing protein, partial [Scardovia wiggsiae]|nr:PASTA domain-containing protein [Scardovia wiggsiae]
AKLKVTMKEEYSSTVDKGHVISASLKAGAQIHWNDTVTVVVSKGPETVTVPDVTGMDFTRARSVLEDMGFTVVQKNTLGIGKTVSSQSIEAGSKVTIMDGSGKPREIVLTVSLFSW